MSTRTFTAAQKQLLEGRLASAMAAQPDWAKLAAQLRSMDGGGGSLIVATYEEDLGRLLDRGEDFSGRPVELIPGQPSRCHANSSKLYAQDRTLTLITGWAMSDDRIWRQHSWLVKPDSALIETTEVRERYFGVALTPQEALSFVFDNG